MSFRRICPFLLNRVLRRKDRKEIVEPVADIPNRYLLLVHGL